MNSGDASETQGHPSDPPGDTQRPRQSSLHSASRLEEARARAKAVLDTMHDGVITIDTHGTIETINQAGCDIFGYDADELIGRNVHVLMPSPYHEEHDEYIHRYLKTGQPRIIGIGREVSGRRKDGSVFAMDLAVTEVVFDGQRLFTGIVRDISDRRELEAKVLHVGAEERRRIGQDLHDGLQQSLAAIAFSLQRLENRLDQETPPDHGQLASSITGIHDMVDAAIDQTRHIARGLYPVKLENDGLHAALNELAASLSRVYGTDCIFEGDESIVVQPFAAAMHLYRIAQEAANNAIRHGQARHLQILLRREPTVIVLEVIDDGSGFSPGEQRPNAPGRGLGLHTMRYRANMIGCTLSIDSTDGQGTTVTVRLPISATP